LIKLFFIWTSLNRFQAFGIAIVDQETCIFLFEISISLQKLSKSS
jgi:hypothetical protein